MNPVVPLPSQHRLNRLELWISLWLVRLLGVLDVVAGDRPDIALCQFVDRALSGFARGLMCLFICRAAARMRPPRRFVHGGPPRDFNDGLRLCFGSALRRAFRARTRRGRLAKLRAVLEAREAHLERLVHRLRKGLTRCGSAHSCVRDGGADCVLCGLCGLVAGVAAGSPADMLGAACPDTS